MSFCSTDSLLLFKMNICTAVVNVKSVFWHEQGNFVFLSVFNFHFDKKCFIVYLLKCDLTQFRSVSLHLKCFCCPPRLGLCCFSHGNRLNCIWLMIVGVVRLYPYFLPNNSYKHKDTCCNYVSVCFFICLEPLPLNYYIDCFVVGCST